MDYLEMLDGLKLSSDQGDLETNQVRVYLDMDDVTRKYFIMTIEEEISDEN